MARGARREARGAKKRVPRREARGAKKRVPRREARGAKKRVPKREARGAKKKPATRKTAQQSVVVTVADSHLSKIGTVAAALRGHGMKVESVMEATGLITG